MLKFVCVAHITWQEIKDLMSLGHEFAHLEWQAEEAGVNDDVD